jgi:hypothetical protein
MDQQPYSLDEIGKRQPRYMRAIKVEIDLMEKAHEKDDIPEQKRRMVRAQGYYKKAMSLIREGR